MVDTHKKPRAIVFAYPLQGHLIPAVHLAMKLASKGFTITFINTQSIDHQISKGKPHAAAGDDIFAEARESGLDIRYATVSDGFPVELDRFQNLVQFREVHLHHICRHVDELVGKIVRTAEPPVSCLVADTFHVWTPMIAKKYNLVNVSFCTQIALVFTLYYHLHLLKNNGHFASNCNRKDTIDYIPGVKAIEPTDLMSYLHDTNISTVLHQIIYKSFDEVKAADFILINTVHELESETISALHQKQPTFAIGPIFPSDFTKSIVATSLWSESDCTQWLNTKPTGSVLYVSFGSLAHVSQDDLMEIAHGLWLSGVSFVWVLRQDIVDSREAYSLPVGFEDSIKDRGLIVTWCTQIAVMSHPSVGGFLTHCGWNSVLEGIWCSLPLLCFPCFSDQIPNRKLVVNDWKIGINLCDEKSITMKEVADKINRLMSGKSADGLRSEVKKVKRTLENAIATDGSSEKNFNQFIKDLEVKIHKKRGLATLSQLP
ncbi:UDP-glycosyltransferase 86A1-like isoform X1 [Cornus florida]|uniref:UDP-glycosyltransferase 86A1-like isoform X1 n=1 Tax=Cornus florida TaxID=4283 RepID=UPI0028A0F637|nr:UDP-glycosyltransferase 86A1-like isoform X1 [Cornus florida]